MRPFRPAALAAFLLVTAFSLAGCFGSGEPSESDMLAAVQKNQKLRNALGAMAMAGSLSGAKRSPDDVIKNLKVEKSACSAAQGSPGFVCDFRIGLTNARGQLEYGPPGKGRFFQAGDGWNVDVER